MDKSENVLVEWILHMTSIRVTGDSVCVIFIYLILGLLRYLKEYFQFSVAVWLGLGKKPTRLGLS